MIRTALFCLLFVQVLTQGPPEKCKKPPHEMKKYFECCSITPLFTDEDLKECGIEKSYYMNNEGTIPKPPDCDKKVCLLKRYNLMKDETTVDRDAFAAILDKWADTNKDFKDAIEVIKTECINGELRGLPDNMCEANKMGICIATHIFANCPNWQDSDDCAKVKDFMNECFPH